MEKLRYFIVILLGILMYSCTSHSPLKKYRETKVNENMMDTISYNLLGAYKETAEVTYLFGFIPLNIYGCGSEHAPISPNELEVLSQEQEESAPLYDKSMMRLLISPKVSTEINFKYLGIYKYKRTTIEGISVSSLSKKEISELVENMK